MGGFALEVLTRLTSGLFAGLRFVEARSSIRARGTRPDVEVPERDRSLLLASLGPHVQVDTRGSTFYPTRGALVDVNAAFYGPALGGSRAFQSYAAGVNACVSTGTGQVLAMRLSGCAVKGDAPFHSLCLFGTHAGRSVHGIRVAHPPPGSRQAVVPHRRGGQASSTSRSAWRSDPGWIPRRRPVCLLYDRGRDVLTGTYFLALQQQTFDVEFVRR